MDRMLNRPRRGNRRRRARNFRAWQRFCPDGRTPYPVRGRLCPFCPHDNTKHLSTSGQPHFYRPATPDEIADYSVMLYTHRTADGDKSLVRRMTVSREAEIVTAFCTACALEMGAPQVLCFQRTLATGEVVDLKTTDDAQLKGEST